VIAYGNVAYFVAMLVLAVPAVVLGLLGRTITRYGMAATVVMVTGLMLHSPAQAPYLAGFLALETALMKGHLAFTGRFGRKVAWERRLTVAAALAPLVVVKLTAAFPVPSLGFIGVSYLTFRAVQVVLEISDGLIKEFRLLDYLYFLAFFPTLASGPIDRSRRFGQDAHLGLDATSYSRLLGRGLWLLLLGAVYKFVAAAWFADRLGEVGGGPSGMVAYMYLYGLDLFFDFAGYSHMAVGASYIFGIRTPMNFRLPFVSESIKDFWNRWHISLSFWLRDFLYTRLLMALLRRKTFKQKTTASHVAFVVNMLAMGLWHGIALHYVVYGLFHGILLVVNDIYERRSSFYARFHRTPAYRIAAIVVTFHLVMFSFLIFSGHLITL